MDQEKIIESILEQAFGKDVSRIKEALDNNIVNEDEVIEAVCHQILEAPNKTLVQILLSRGCLEGEKYKPLKEVNLKDLSKTQRQQMSKKNLYIANSLVDYNVCSREQIAKYLQILQKLDELGLSYSWTQFAQKTKLLQPELVNAILIRVEKKIKTLSVTQTNQRKRLHIKKNKLPLLSKLILLFTMVAIFLFPVVIFALASYQTGTNQKQQETVIKITKLPQKLQKPKTPSQTNYQFNQEQYLATKNLKKWGKFLVTIKQWEELNQNYPHKMISSSVKMRRIDIRKNDSKVIINGFFQAPKMPEGLRLQLCLEVHDTNNTLLHQVSVSLDAKNSFHSALDLQKIGYYHLSIRLELDQQVGFTKQYVKKDRKWSYLLQLGTKKSIAARVEMETKQILKILEDLSNIFSSENPQHAFANIGFLFAKRSTSFHLKDKAFQALQFFFAKWKKEKQIVNKKSEYLLHLYNLQILFHQHREYIFSRYYDRKIVCR